MAAGFLFVSRVTNPFMAQVRKLAAAFKLQQEKQREYRNAATDIGGYVGNRS